MNQYIEIVFECVDVATYSPQLINFQMTIEDKNVDIPQLRKLTKEEEWRNFWTFLFKPIPKSIVYDVY